MLRGACSRHRGSEGKFPRTSWKAEFRVPSTRTIEILRRIATEEAEEGEEEEEEEGEEEGEGRRERKKEKGEGRRERKRKKGEGRREEREGQGEERMSLGLIMVHFRLRMWFINFSARHSQLCCINPYSHDARN
jgi:hypothetical protein